MFKWLKSAENCNLSADPYENNVVCLLKDSLEDCNESPLKMAAVTPGFEPWSTGSNEYTAMLMNYMVLSQKKVRKQCCVNIRLWSTVWTPVCCQEKSGRQEWYWSFVRHSTSVFNFSLVFNIFQNEYTLTMNSVWLLITCGNYLCWTVAVMASKRRLKHSQCFSHEGQKHLFTSSLPTTASSGFRCVSCCLYFLSSFF